MDLPISIFTHFWGLWILQPKTPSWLPRGWTHILRSSLPRPGPAHGKWSWKKTLCFPTRRAWRVSKRLQVYIEISLENWWVWGRYEWIQTVWVYGCIANVYYVYTYSYILGGGWDIQQDPYVSTKNVCSFPNREGQTIDMNLFGWKHSLEYPLALI